MNKTLLKLYLAEFIGTALLLGFGLSIVIFNWGEGTVMESLVPDAGWRRLLTGFLFGTTGCLVTLSPVGKISGAHINPAVSIAFWLCGKMKDHALVGYIISQLLGAVVGCLPLLLWGAQGKSVAYANTVPGDVGIVAAFIGEVITTAGLITLLYIFVSSDKLRDYTPYTMPFLYGFMVWAESPLSGCSTNPARSFGPAVVSGVYTAQWVYWLAPLTGVLLVMGFVKMMNIYRHHEMEAARVSYHDEHSPQSIKTSS
ncbi:MIP/aquaporin family protein [Mucilaginibacter terrae]|uniref:Aquaporin Z n=1 Tax=Mucilaginibacter terrae TaxID=1955052 RepID=A0ABU3GTN8_9SPHI|nr:aquaporin [Mucilaginibacter terrae]MDT3403119.1 aquaporin Z [Mucilaginibacter terrae]